jgi:hypothetical protein
MEEPDGHMRGERERRLNHLLRVSDVIALIRATCINRSATVIDPHKHEVKEGEGTGEKKLCVTV